jgi:pimeloyl-[acyl-carrier protein] methyl ester esterase
MSLYVERHGSGPDLVLLHGWGLHGGVWHALAARLAGSFRLHVVDLPGHGHSRESPFADLDTIVDTVAERTPEDATLCGWSLGGLLAMRLAARHPSRCARLALISTSPSFIQRKDWPHAMAHDTLASFADDLHNDPARTIRTFLNLNAFGGPQPRERMRELAALLVERGTPSPTTLAAGLRMLLETDLRDGLADIDRPATVIHGARDALTPVSAGRWMAQTLRFARLVEIDDAAHLPFVSHADVVVDALEALHG